jgi:hypothetical protein
LIKVVLSFVQLLNPLIINIVISLFEDS